MILTDYYRFERLATKSKMRLDCVTSTESYTEFDEKVVTKFQRATEKRDAANIGDLLIYLGNVPKGFRGDVHRKADKSISIKGKHLSSVFTPDVTNNFGYGDVKGTSDALLFVFHKLKIINGVIQQASVVEIFVARGKSKNQVALYESLCDGDLDEEMKELRTRAIPRKG